MKFDKFKEKLDKALSDLGPEGLKQAFVSLGYEFEEVPYGKSALRLHRSITMVTIDLAPLSISQEITKFSGSESHLADAA